MLGKIIVRRFRLLLNIVGVLAILCGTLCGAYLGSSSLELVAALGEVPGWVGTVVGLLVGFVVSFVAVALLLGVPFLLIEVHENVLKIRRQKAVPPGSQIPLTPDLV